VIRAYEKHHVCAVILEHPSTSSRKNKGYGCLTTRSNKIHRYPAKHGYAARNPRKQKKRRWIRYERKHSMSPPCPSGTWTGSRSANWADYTGQVSGKTGSEPRKWLAAVQDDASKKIMEHGVSQNATALLPGTA